MALSGGYLTLTRKSYVNAKASHEVPQCMQCRFRKLSSTACIRLHCSLSSYLTVSLSPLLAPSFPGAVPVSLPTEWRLRSRLSSTECIRLHCSLSSYLFFYPLLTLSLPIGTIVTFYLEEFVYSIPSVGTSSPALPAYNAVSTSTSLSSAQSFRSYASSSSASSMTSGV
jgi:hypothetical protein